MDNASQKIAGEIRIPSHIFELSSKGITNVLSFKEKIESSLSASTSEISEMIFSGAISLGLSDIHLEPLKTEVKLRGRIDGLLQDVITLDLQVYKTLLSRIKLLSGIKLNIADKPQDGRFSILLPTDESIEVRSSSLPSEYGEAVVLRILNPKSLISIDQLGVESKFSDLLKKEIKQPNGIIIVTGPTGSGKTTTLYAILKEISRPEVKIITLEDPIEYHLNGVSQTQVDAQKGYDFANGLRAILRQDPDVILVGEVRDLETASISLQAALTGHLVLTTLHTNDASGTIPRLQALGEKPVNIAPAINLIIAQRLIRKTCDHCKKMIKPSPEEVEKIKAVLKNLPVKDMMVPKVTGCEECNFTGYKGRIGIFEFMEINEKMREKIMSSAVASDLEKTAKENGMRTMEEDGFLKILDGITTIEEVERIIGEHF